MALSTPSWTITIPLKCFRVWAPKTVEKTGANMIVTGSMRCGGMPKTCAHCLWLCCLTALFVTLLCHPDFPGHRWGCGSSWKFWLLIPLVYLQVRNLFVKILLRLWSTHDPTTEKAPLLHRELVFLEAFSQTLTVASPHRNKNQQGATVSSLLAQKQVARRLRSCIPPP